jgi:hypothetical protein
MRPRKDIFTDAMRAELGASMPADFVEHYLAHWGYRYAKSFCRQFRCGAHARSTGKPCRAPAMKNGRCRRHGGMSTGPRTPEGRARISEVQRARHAKSRRASRQSETAARDYAH